MLFTSWQTPETLLLVVPELVESRGSVVPDWSRPPAHLVELEGCVVEPLSAEERGANREAVQGALEARVPRIVDVPAFARVRRPLAGGRDFEVIGEPRHFRSPTGALDHTALLLKRWEG